MREKEPKIFLMGGIPGSGKSTIANELEKKYRIPVFSSDRVRFALFDYKVTNIDYWKDIDSDVHAIVNKFVIMYAKAFKSSFIIDECIIRESDIKRYRIPGYKIILLLSDVPKNIVYERNRNRNRVVPRRVMDLMYADFKTLKQQLRKGEIKDLTIIPFSDRRRILMEARTAYINHSYQNV